MQKNMEKFDKKQHFNKINTNLTHTSFNSNTQGLLYKNIKEISFFSLLVCQCLIVWLCIRFGYNDLR